MLSNHLEPEHQFSLVRPGSESLEVLTFVVNLLVQVKRFTSDDTLCSLQMETLSLSRSKESWHCGSVWKALF